VQPTTPRSAHPAPFQFGDDAFSARDRLLQSISEDNDLPSLGASVARVVQLASSDDEAVRGLASFVLSDVALTQKILRIANTVEYRTYSTAPVTTISKAIFMLGFDVIKTAALAMLLVDGMSGKRANSVRTELSHALSASVIGRELARRSPFRDAEEAAVAALFKNMGRLLVAAHDHALYVEIATQVEKGGHSPTQASMQVLGISFEALGESVLQEWQIPDTIISALNPLPQGVLRPAKSRGEWMQQVAAFSTAAATLMTRPYKEGPDPARKALLTRFGAALNLDEESMELLFAKVLQESRVLYEQTNLVLTSGVENSGEGMYADQQLDQGELEEEDGLPSELLMAMEPEDSEASIERYPSGKPLNAREQLMTGVQDVTEMMASGRVKVNDLMVLVLETIYNSMGFRFATICVRDVKTGQYRARVSLGENSAARQAGFAFQTSTARDVFQLAMENNADVVIADTSTAKIRDLLPGWYRTQFSDARSFIVLPLVVQAKPFGFFYADRTLVAPEGIPSDETSLIRTLKSQVLAALNPR
jgi:HD-like signal output (HDOD) protein